MLKISRNHTWGRFNHFKILNQEVTLWWSEVACVTFSRRKNNRWTRSEFYLMRFDRIEFGKIDHDDIPF